MTREDIKNIVIKIIADKMYFSVQEIQEGTRFKEDIGMDSLDDIELLIKFEREFGIKIPDEEISRVLSTVRTVGDAIDGICQKLGVSICKQHEFAILSNMDEAANIYGMDIRLGYPRVMDEIDKYIYNAFKAGAEWMNNQMKMPNSTELNSEWNNVKKILEEKDFRGDEWRLAYNAFMFGFSRGINTQTKKI